MENIAVESGTLPDPDTEPGGSRRAIVAALAANLGVAAIKLIGFLITGSAGLLAEGFHSLADTGNEGLLLLGGRRSRKRRDVDHPFGYGRERYFWSFVVALVLFSLGGVFAVVEGVDKFMHPHDPSDLLIAVAILVLATVIEGFSLRTAVHEINQVKPRSQTLWRFVRDAKEPELTVVLLEDTAAEAGLMVALVGVLAAHVTGDARWDAAGSIVIGLLLIVVAGVLAIEMKGLLIGESATPAMRKLIRDTLQAAPLVNRVIHVRTEHLGPNELLVATKLEFVLDLSVEEVARAIDETEAELREAVPSAVHIYIEPDVYRAEPE